MNKGHALLLAMIMMSVSLAGCLDLNGIGQKQNACNELDFIAHEVTISYVEYEFESYLDASAQYGVLYIKNADLIYLEDATQVLANGQIYDLDSQSAPVLDTHTTVYVFTNPDNDQPQLMVNKDDVVCLIENPDVQYDLKGEIGRVCATDSYRLENGSYEHAHPMCNYVLTEHLDRTSTIRGGIELPQNLAYDACSYANTIMNVYNGSFVSLNYTVEGSVGHFVEGNEFRIYYSDQDQRYHKSYFVKELTEQRHWGSIYSKGISNDGFETCGIAYVQLYADENFTELASLDRDLTTNDSWEVIAQSCYFERVNFYLGSSEMPIMHGCIGYAQPDWDWLQDNQPGFDLDAELERVNRNEERPEDFFQNFTQAAISKNYSVWHSMLADEVHAINSNVSYQKENLNETFFENFTSALGTIEFDNASRMDLAQSHWRLVQSYFPDSNTTFNWSFDQNNRGFMWEVASPMAESALLQDRIYNSTGWGYDGIFIESTEHEIMTWVAGPNTTPLINEYLLTIVVDRNDDGSFSIVGMADYTVDVSR